MDYLLDLPGQLNQAGLMDAMLRASVSMSTTTRLRADLHHLRLARQRANRKTLGTELDLVGNWSMAKTAGLEAGGGLFLPADLVTRFLPAFANGSDPTFWGYLQLTLSWP
jgi:hypothetical protein